MQMKRREKDDDEMTLARRGLWRPYFWADEVDRWIEDLRAGMEDLFWVPRRWRGMGAYAPDFVRPRVDIMDKGDEMVITAELPGIPKENIEVNITDDMLEIKAEKTEEVEEKDAGYIRRERGYRSFYRRLPLPADVITEKAEATLSDGILEIRIKKKKPAKRKGRRIEVK